MGCKMFKGQTHRSNSLPKTSADQSSMELSELQIQDLNRKELQTYCKKYGIKANAKTTELREKLLHLVRSQQEEKTDELNNNESRDENISTVSRSAKSSSTEANSTKPSSNLPKSKKKLKDKAKVPSKEKLDKDKTTLNKQRPEEDGKRVTGVKKSSAKSTIKKQDSEGTALKNRKEKTIQKKLNDKQDKIDVKGSKKRKELDQSSNKTVRKPRGEEKVDKHEERVGQEDGNYVDVSHVGSSVDADRKNDTISSKDVAHEDDQAHSNTGARYEVEDVEKHQENFHRELSPVYNDTPMVDRSSRGNEVIESEQACQDTSKVETPLLQENGLNDLSSTQGTYCTNDQADNSDKENERETEIHTVLSCQNNDTVDSVYDGMALRDGTSKSNGNIEDVYHAAGHRVESEVEDDDDHDSVYDEIINEDDLNNTFGLDKTFDVQPNRPIPCLMRARNATFIVQRETSEKESFPCDSTSTADDDSGSVTKSSTVCSRWCVVDGMVKNDREASWKLAKLKGGRPVVPNRFGKYIQFILEPSQRDVPPDFRDNFICGACAALNEKEVAKRDALKNATISSTSQFDQSDKNSSTPKTSFVRNTEIRSSVKRKRGDDGEWQSRELETQRTKRHKKTSLTLINKNPASPTVRKARGEAIELPKNHRNPWRPKVPSRSNTPVDVTEDASYAEKVEAIIQNTLPGSEEELMLMMARKCLVQRSPTKKISATN